MHLDLLVTFRAILPYGCSNQEANAGRVPLSPAALNAGCVGDHGLEHPRFACTTAWQFRPDRCTTACTPDLRQPLPVHELYSAVIRS